MIKPAIFLAALIIPPIIVLAGFFYLAQIIPAERSRPKPIVEFQPPTKSLQNNPSGEVSEKTIREAQDAIAQAQTVVAQAQEFLARQEKEEQSRQEQIYSSKKIKGVYMTGFIAMGQSSAALNLRDSIVDMIASAELNGLVIDVKESDGPYNLDYFKDFISELHQKNIWSIARIVAFADSSLLDSNPELYCKGIAGTIWQDSGGRYWLDPGNEKVQDYIIDFSKKVIDAGFNELQFDYVRFPAEGDLKDLVCNASSQKDKTEIISEFFSKLSSELRNYKPDIILSADLFGLTAIQLALPEIGQDIKPAAQYFDYLSFMVYPSHFYGGFQVPEDTVRNLPALSFPYESADISEIAVNHPYDVVYRSLLRASDYISQIGVRARIRPWLQDFNLKFDRDRGIVYDVAQVKAQIQAAEDAGSSGWLFWNPSNIYTKNAFIPTNSDGLTSNK